MKSVKIILMLIVICCALASQGCSNAQKPEVQSVQTPQKATAPPHLPTQPQVAAQPQPQAKPQPQAQPQATTKLPVPAQPQVSAQPQAPALPLAPAQPQTPPPAQPQTSTEPNGPQPKISFEKTTHDFGPVAPGSVAPCEFKFQNKGAGTLVINDISKTCGCTVPTLDKKEYAPGETGIIKVDYSADNGVGIRTRHLYVSSNDKDNPRVELTILSVIAQKVVNSPERLDFALKGSHAGMAELTLRSTDGKSFAVTKFQATSDAVTASFDSKQNADNFVIQTKIDPNKMGPNTNGRIEITLTHPECSSITVPFTLLPRFSTDPPALNIINAEPNKPVRRELWILNNYEEDFEIVSTESKAGLIQILNREKLDKRYKLTLEITPPLTANRARMFIDTLYVTTTGGDRIEIFCRGFYQRK